MCCIPLLLIHFMLRSKHLNKYPVSFPIFSVIQMAKTRLLFENSTPVERNWRLSTETLWIYTQDAAVKLSFSNFSCFNSFGNKRLKFCILTLRLYKQMAWGLRILTSLYKDNVRKSLRTKESMFFGGFFRQNTLQTKLVFELYLMNG